MIHQCWTKLFHKITCHVSNAHTVQRPPLLSFTFFFNHLIMWINECKGRENILFKNGIRMICTKRQDPDNNDSIIAIYHFGTSSWFLHPRPKNINVFTKMLLNGKIKPMFYLLRLSFGIGYRFPVAWSFPIYLALFSDALQNPHTIYTWK